MRGQETKSVRLKRWAVPIVGLVLFLFIFGLHLSSDFHSSMGFGISTATWKYLGIFILIGLLAAMTFQNKSVFTRSERSGWDGAKGARTLRSLTPVTVKPLSDGVVVESDEPVKEKREPMYDAFVEKRRSTEIAGKVKKKGVVQVSSEELREVEVLAEDATPVAPIESEQQKGQAIDGDMMEVEVEAIPVEAEEPVEVAEIAETDTSTVGEHEPMETEVLPYEDKIQETAASPVVPPQKDGKRTVVKRRRPKEYDYPVKVPGTVYGDVKIKADKGIVVVIRTPLVRSCAICEEQEKCWGFVENRMDRQEFMENAECKEGLKDILIAKKKAKQMTG